MSLDFVLFVFWCLSYLAGIYNIYRIVITRPSPAVGFAWILLHISAPILGIILYTLVGRNRLRQERREKYRNIALGEPRLTKLVENCRLVTESLDDSSRIFADQFTKIDPLLGPQIGKITLLQDGSETFGAIFSAIENAQEYILIQYYILRSDRLGLELLRLLKKKAQDGIQIYLLYDSVGSFWLSQKYLTSLILSGVKTARFLPLANLKSFIHLNFRNHRKLVIIDGVLAFTGGLNVGEEYLTGIKLGRKKRLSWRDTHICLQGDCVTLLQALFFEDWFFTTKTHLELGAAFSSSAPTPVSEEKPKKELCSFKTQDHAQIQIIPSGPSDLSPLSSYLFLTAINQAKKFLWVSTPYFVPDVAVQRSLELAVLRGVDVRILLPKIPDQRLVHWCSLSFAEQLSERGIKFFSYEKGFIHQKVLLIDGQMSIMGTTNFDQRAMFLNFETNVLIHGQEFSRRIQTMLEVDFAQATPLKNTGNAFIRRFLRLRGDVVRLFAPLL